MQEVSIGKSMKIKGKITGNQDLLIDGSRAGTDPSVHGDDLSGMDDDFVAGFDRGQRNFDLKPFGEEPRSLRLLAEEIDHLGFGAPLDPRHERAAHRCHEGG